MTAGKIRKSSSKATQAPTVLATLTPAQLAEATRILQEIAQVELARCHFDIVLASTSGKDDPPAYRRVSIANDTATAFRQTIAGILEPLKFLLPDQHMAVEEFSVEPVDAERVIEYIDVSQPEFDVIQQQLVPLASNYQGLSHFEQGDRPFVAGLRFYAILVRSPQFLEPIYFFRHYAPSKLLSEATLFGISWQHDFYSRISEPTLLFDRFIDCLSYQQHLFILRKDDFYTDFRYLDAIEAAARQTLQQLEGMELIADFQRFYDDCMRHRSKKRTLKNIAVRHYLDGRSIEQIEHFLQEHPAVRITVDIFDGKKKMLYNPGNPYAILHLLNDNILDSDLTNNSYQAGSKQGLGKR